MMKDVKKTCIALAKQLGVHFVLRSKKISADEVFSEVGLLPAIAKRAEQLSLLCFNQDLGVEFVDSDNAMLGVEIKAKDKQMSLVGLVCISDVIVELTRGMRNGGVNVDELLYD